MTLRIKDWDIRFEVNRTREIKGKMKWFALKTNHDSDGYTELLSHPNPVVGAALFGGWIALLKVAATCRPRGTLVRSCGTDHDIVTLSRISRIPAEIFRDLIPRLKKLKWIEEFGEETAIPQDYAPASQVGVSTIQYNTIQEEEEDLLVADPPKTKKAKKPVKKFSEASEAFRISDYLWQWIRYNNPDAKKPNLQSWAKDADLMLRIDERSFHETCELIEWAQKDGFWKANVLSIAKLRKQYDQLTLQRKRPASTGVSHKYGRQLMPDDSVKKIMTMELD